MTQQLFKYKSLLFSSCRRLHVASTRSARHDDSDEVTSAVTRAGYRAEVHKVKTEDGFVLKVHRVLPVKHSVNKGTAFLMHGLSRHSFDYIATGPKRALAYYLADHGYDVWMGNARGSKFSSEHVKYSLTSKEFWNFSFHEIGLYDVSAMLDFMFDQTKSTKTFYAGHSQGTTSIAVLLSMRPEFNEKIAQAHLMTPAVFMKNSSSPMVALPTKYSAVMKYAKRFNKVDATSLLNLADKLRNVNGSFNKNRAMKLYLNTTCPIIGRNKNEIQIDEEGLKTFHIGMSPVVSMKQLLHFFQLHLSGKFCQFDHGDLNQILYNSPHPPEYELHKATAAIYLYSASEDILTPPKDAELLKTKLPNVKSFDKLHDFNHMDVMLGRDSRKLLYKNILKSMNNEY